MTRPQITSHHGDRDGFRWGEVWFAPADTKFVENTDAERVAAVLAALSRW